MKVCGFERSLWTCYYKFFPRNQNALLAICCVWRMFKPRIRNHIHKKSHTRHSKCLMETESLFKIVYAVFSSTLLPIQCQRFVLSLFIISIGRNKTEQKKRTRNSFSPGARFWRLSHFKPSLTVLFVETICECFGTVVEFSPYQIHIRAPKPYRFYTPHTLAFNEHNSTIRSHWINITFYEYFYISSTAAKRVYRFLFWIDILQRHDIISILHTKTFTWIEMWRRATAEINEWKKNNNKNEDETLLFANFDCYSRRSNTKSYKIECKISIKWW